MDDALRGLMGDAGRSVAGVADRADADAPFGESDFVQASPEEQAQYDQIVSNALTIMAPQGSVNPAVVERLRATGDPVEDAANAAVVIMSQVVRSARENGVELSPDAIFHAGKEVVEHVVELAEAAGIHDFSEEEMEMAFFRAVDEYRRWGEASGFVDRKELQKDFARIVEADRMGKLEELLPGIMAYADKRGRMPDERDEPLSDMPESRMKVRDKSG